MENAGNVVENVELVKNITVKDFASFRDNEFYVSIESDAAFGGNPFAINGVEWKQKRSHITGSFTGGKIKAMFSNIRIGSQSMSKYLKALTECGSKVFEAKEFCCLYTLETALCCAYGIEAQVFDKPNSHFYEMGQKLYYHEYLGKFKFFLSIIFPKIAKFLRVRFTNEQTEAQLFDMIRTSLEYRDKSNIDVKDFMSTIASLRSTYNEKEILALATAFYLDGQETTGLVMGHLLYELAANPEAQKKLRNGSRPPLVIEKGTPVMIPLYGIHYDPKYYDDPYKFIPERFLDSNVKQYLLGFGEGPRACIGRRFGIVQVKTGVAYLIKDFEISVNQKTQLPLRTDAWDFLVVSQGMYYQLYLGKSLWEKSLRHCTDMELVKSILVKDFASFHDNEFYISIESDAAFGGNPFAIKGDEWKKKRSHITGSFTAGKIKSMFSNIQNGAQSMSKYLSKQTECGPKVLEAKEFCCLYTLETVLSCAYGVEAHVFDKPNSHFFEMGQKLFTNEQTEMQLFDIIRTSLEHRDKTSTDVKDFMSAIASVRSRYSEKEILSLAAAFYLDGQETTGLVMGHLLYELAANPDAQKKLRSEVKDHFEKDGGQLTYESLQEMPYLDACFKGKLNRKAFQAYT
nr:unnamed protein product [Callosobruchus analis]